MRRLSIRRCAIGLTLALAGALPVAAFSPAEPAAAALPPVSAIGDSTLLGMTASSRAIVGASYSFLWEAKSCRRLIITSCRGRGVIPPNTIQTMQAYNGRLGDAVAIMAGYDDWYDFPRAVDTIVGEAKRQGIGTVIWLTYRSQGPYVGIGGAYWATYRSFNAILAQKALEYPELQVADWDTYTRGQSSWFSADGIHLSSSGATALGYFLRAQYDSLRLQRCYGALGGTPTAAPAAGAVVQAAPGGVTPIAGRALDTRAGAPLAAGAAVAIPLAAQGRVPAGTVSVMVNITAVTACRGGGFLTAYPCGSPVPLASHLNVLPGRTRAAMASVMLNAQGQLCVYSSVSTDVLVDVLGAVGPGGLRLNPTVPDRLVDTRSGQARFGHVGAIGTTAFAVPVAGVGVVPAGAKAVLLNVAVLGPSTQGFLTVHQCGTAPGSSNLNFRAGQVVANAATVAIAGNGTICFTSSSPTHLLVDVLGWFGDTGLRVRAQTPERLVDTRTPFGAPPGPVRAGGTVAVPAGASGILATVTAVRPAAVGYLTATPCGSVPNASNVNFVPGDVVPNLVQLSPGAGGNGCVFTSASTHILVDRAATLVA